MSTDFNSQILAELGSLMPDEKRRVLQYVLALKRGDAGTPGAVLAGFAGAIPADDLELMRAAIEEGCERIDQDEW